MNKLIIFVQLFVFAFAGYNQSLRGESNFILLCVFNYVTYINPHTLHPFIGNFGPPRESLITSAI